MELKRRFKGCLKRLSISDIKMLMLKIINEYQNYTAFISFPFLQLLNSLFLYFAGVRWFLKPNKSLYGIKSFLKWWFIHYYRVLIEVQLLRLNLSFHLLISNTAYLSYSPDPHLNSLPDVFNLHC